MRNHVVVSRGHSRDLATAITYGGSRKENNGGLVMEERVAEYRRALDSGRCVYIGDRWYPADITRKERNALVAAYHHRLDKNRRQREYAARIRAERHLEELISSLPPWVQAKRYGRTAETTRVNGFWRMVDYGKTYGRHGDIPMPMPDDFVVETMFDFAAAAAAKLTVPKKSTSTIKAPEFAKGPLPTNPVDRTEVERRNRLRAERRKCIRRATCAECPTATDIRVAWEFRKERNEGILQLGAMLLNLECYVDNSIIFEQVSSKDEKGTSGNDEVHAATANSEPGANVMIRGRNPGLRGWIRDNCPELHCRYKTLMRYKAMANKLRQAIELPDPVPLSAIFDSSTDLKRLWSNGVHEQPRPESEGEGLVVRFAWEQSTWEYDANDRLFRKNARYRHVLPFNGGFEHFKSIIQQSRKDVADIFIEVCADNILSDQSPNDIMEIMPIHRRMIGKVSELVENALKRRELWWREFA